MSIATPERGTAELVTQLRATIARMEVALGAIGESIVWTDGSGVIEWCNHTFEQAVGRPRIAILGASIFQVLPLERADAPIHGVPHPVAVASAEGSSPQHVYRWQGRDTVVELSARRCQTGTAAPNVVVAFRDVTGRIALEAEVRRTSDELRAQYGRLQVADRLKSDLLANMSHELRTPLNGIIGFGELLHDGGAGEVTARQRKYLGHILDSSRHLLRLINDVLDLAKVGSGKVELRPEPVEPARVVREVTESLRTLSAAKQLHVDQEIAPGLGAVVVDPTMLRQVIHHYLSNAMKFTPAGGRVRISVRPEGIAELLIEISDSGPGIDAGDQDRLFVAFQQLDSGTAKEHQGIGLGLALTKQIVEAQGGRVGVRSVVGEGSTFFAVLPRHDVESG